MSDARSRMSLDDRQALDERVRKLVDGSIVTKAMERFLAQIIAEVVATKDAEIAKVKAGARFNKGVATLEQLLRMQVKYPNGNYGSPEFRVAVQGERDGGVHFIIHASGHDSETLDLVAVGNELRNVS